MGGGEAPVRAAGAPEGVRRAIERTAALNREGRFEESLTLAQKALIGAPEAAELWNNLGVALARTGRLEEAETAFTRALRRQPQSAAAAGNLAAVLIKRGRLREALELAERALELNPESVEARNNLATLLRKLGRLAEARGLLEEALRLDAACPETWAHMATLMRDQGLAAEAVALYRRALELGADAHFASLLLLCLNYLPEADPMEVYAEHRQWARRFAEPLAGAIPPHRNDPSPERPLRIGYLSAEFRRHPVMSFLRPVLTAHDREQFHVTCYADVASPDEETARLRALGHAWRDISSLSDEQLAELIRADGIDILVDLAGHTPNHRLLALARKPAPVQVTWLGYPNTTGLSTIDYRITDAWADPPGWTEHLHSERLVRLPRGFSCWAPPEEAPDPGPLPAARSGRVSFGSFNFAAKITDQVVATWAQILRRAPTSRLLLKYPGLSDPGLQESFRARFRRGGVEAERLWLVGETPSFREHLRYYREVDIALDPFPYNGTTTTCEALWMGVPVVTLAGRTHAGRVGVSLLSNVGMEELIADSTEAYVRLAVELASDLDRLERLRARLRGRMARAPLTDAQGFTRTLEQAYREMWRCWASRHRPPKRLP